MGNFLVKVLTTVIITVLYPFCILIAVLLMGVTCLPHQTGYRAMIKRIWI